MREPGGYDNEVCGTADENTDITPKIFAVNRLFYIT